MYTKYIFIIISLQTNCSSRDTIPLSMAILLVDTSPFSYEKLTTVKHIRYVIIVLTAVNLTCNQVVKLGVVKFEMIFRLPTWRTGYPGLKGIVFCDYICLTVTWPYFHLSNRNF